MVERSYGGHSMVAPLRRVLVKRPDEHFAVDDPVPWHYGGRPDLQSALEEHGAFVALLRQQGVEVFFHDEPQHGRADAIFVHDPALVTDAGAVILRPGKRLREGEEVAITRRLESLGVPVAYALQGEARADGGDLVWLDEEALAVGLGFRTNAEGLRQLGEALGPLGVKVIPVELPYHQGPDACLHLMSLISPVDYRTAVVYLPFLSVPFWRELRARGYRLVEVPPEEWETLGPNVLALAPGRCVMLEGNPVTRRRLEAAGCEVFTFRGQEICLKAEGGPTCLTLPILRA